ncbi:MAG: hypothetical protein EOO31_10925 [Comamonadaceae bacterium]|nr:MAG: hypothetical protein EOO31_10925 [Comamonadaceae bacterium]
MPRSAAKGTQTVGSPFLCLLSFGEAKESECAAGRISRPRNATPPIGCQKRPPAKRASNVQTFRPSRVQAFTRPGVQALKRSAALPPSPQSAHAACPPAHASSRCCQTTES